MKPKGLTIEMKALDGVHSRGLHYITVFIFVTKILKI